MCHVLGGRHVEQMYSDLGSDWRKALKGKEGEVDDDILGVVVGWYETVEGGGRGVPRGGSWDMGQI